MYWNLEISIINSKPMRNHGAACFRQVLKNEAATKALKASTIKLTPGPTHPLATTQLSESAATGETAKPSESAPTGEAAQLSESAATGETAQPSESAPNGEAAQPSESAAVSAQIHRPSSRSVSKEVEVPPLGVPELRPCDGVDSDDEESIQVPAHLLEEIPPLTWEMIQQLKVDSEEEEDPEEYVPQYCQPPFPEQIVLSSEDSDDDIPVPACLLQEPPPLTFDMIRQLHMESEEEEELRVHIPPYCQPHFPEQIVLSSEDSDEEIPVPAHLLEHRPDVTTLCPRYESD